MNKFIGMGRITKDLDITTTQGGMAILKFGIAINRRKKGESDFFNCVAFEKNATNIAQYFKKGAMIAIEGRLQSGSYEKDGKKVYTTDIMVDGFHFTGEKKANNSNEQQGLGIPDRIMYDENGEDELPF